MRATRRSARLARKRADPEWNNRAWSISDGPALRSRRLGRDPKPHGSCPEHRFSEGAPRCIAAQFASDALGVSSDPDPGSAHLERHSQPWVTSRLRGIRQATSTSSTLGREPVTTTEGPIPGSSRSSRALQRRHDRSNDGLAPVIANNSADPYGPGGLPRASTRWSVTGSGNGRYFRAGNRRHLSEPSERFGTLIKTHGTFTYTAKDGRISQFNQGRLISMTDPQGCPGASPTAATRSHHQSRWRLTTTSYTAGLLSSLVAQGDVPTPTGRHGKPHLGRLPGWLRRTFSYDDSHRVSDLGSRNTTFTYDATTGGLTNANNGSNTLINARRRRFQTSPALAVGSVYATLVDALRQHTQQALLKLLTPDGSTQELEPR